MARRKKRKQPEQRPPWAKSRTAAAVAHALLTGDPVDDPEAQELVAYASKHPGAPDPIFVPWSNWKWGDGFTWDLAFLILALICQGASLHWIAKHEGYPHVRSWYFWLTDNPIHEESGLSLRDLYHQAREIQGDSLAAFALEVADGPGDVADRRLRYEAFKWYAGKMNNKWNDKVKVEHDLGSDTAERMRTTARATLQQKVKQLQAETPEVVIDVEPE